MLRLFVAVDLPASEQHAVAALYTGVQGARWANPHQLHITLRFMGATPDEELPDIRQRLATVKATSFHLALAGVGVFPATRRPRVLWLGLEPAGPLVRLKHEIDSALSRSRSEEPLEERKEFHPHLTLARFPGKPDESLTHFLARHANYRSTEWDVGCFRLYKSTLHASGSVHETLAAYPITEICRER
jgi:2'-5' RNA ligase